MYVYLWVVKNVWLKHRRVTIPIKDMNERKTMTPFIASNLLHMGSYGHRKVKVHIYEYVKYMKK